MDKILNIISKETSCKSYKSYRYCFDDVKVQSLKYEAEKAFTIYRDKYGETDTSLKASKDLTKKAKEVKNLSPLFRFFLDGSRRIYKVDDLEVNGKIYPLIAGQISVGCCKRNDEKDLKVELHNHSLVISLPEEVYKDESKYATNFFLSLINKINSLNKIQEGRLNFSKALRYSSSKLEGNEKYEDRGTEKIQDEMTDCEKRIVAELVKLNKINCDNFLLKDGSLQYRKIESGDFRELSQIKENYRNVVGVSKAFNPELSKDRNNRSNAAKIADLKLYHRTPAFVYKTERVGDVLFAIWYLRIRDSVYSESPFAGIIKVEKVLITDNEINEGLESDHVDLISANLINESFPVCYGKDSRWANHLYPIFLTESFIKSKYISDLHFLNLF